MIEWIKDKFWGRIIIDHVPILHQIWDILNEKGHIGEKNAYVYGDIDVGVWIEKVNNPDDKKVIASTRYCACADDNTHLYIMNNYQYFEDCPMLFHFLCRTVWPREKRTRYGKEYSRWGDDRDIDIPSINTYRKRNFKFSYSDCRDKGHVFTLEGEKSDKSTWSENRISHALTLFRWHLDALQSYEENKC